MELTHRSDKIIEQNIGRINLHIGRSNEQISVELYKNKNNLINKLINRDIGRINKLLSINLKMNQARK